MEQARSASARFGEAGLVRLIAGVSSGFEATIANEGDADFALDKADSWFLLTATHGRVPLHWDAPKRPVLHPYETVRLRLAPQAEVDGLISGFVYVNKQLGGEVVLEAPFEDCRPVITVPGAYDVALASGREEIVELTAVIGTDGRVEKVVDPLASQAAPRWREAAGKALAAWRFEPAREGGIPQRTFTTVKLKFGKAQILRARFPVVATELLSHLLALVGESSYVVVPLPTVGGFVIGSAVERNRRIPHAFLVRTGAEPDTADASWITVRVLRFQSHGWCDCLQPIASKGEAGEFLASLSANLHREPVRVDALSDDGSSLLPSGLPEDPHAGAWRDETVEELLRLLLSTKQSGEALAPADSRIPREADFFEDRGVETSVGIVAPQLLHRVNPRYPAYAGGSVTVQAIIDARGNVTRPEVVRSAGTAMDAAVLDAICCWKYKPATVDGRPVKVYFTIVVTFGR